MTTEQEIIDYIKEHIYQYSDYMGLSNRYECDKLAQMIKDLKPEIKVKGLVWIKDTSELEQNKSTWTNNTNSWLIWLHKNLFELIGNNAKGNLFLEKFSTFDEAEKGARKMHDEYVLSLVEVDDEN